DPALERSGAAQLAAVGREENEFGDVPRATVVGVTELSEELRHRRGSLRCVACREDTRAAAERVHLEARVLRADPGVLVLAAEIGLDPRVLVVGRSGLGGVVVAVERLDRPARQEPLELLCLVRVTGAEDGAKDAHARPPRPAASRSRRSRLPRAR